MNEYRKNGIIVGILYILGTISGILSAVLTGSMDNSHEYFVQIASENNQYILGTLFILCMGFSLAFIPVVIYPILKKQNKILALGYVVFRGALETVTYIATFVCMLLLLETGKNINEFENIISLIFKLHELCLLTMIFVFSIGALIFYTVLFKSKLIPLWLSAWGIIAIVFHIITGILILFGLQTEGSMINSIMNFPIFLQEMVMAIWLIIKGFNKEMDKKINKE